MSLIRHILSKEQMAGTNLMKVCIAHGAAKMMTCVDEYEAGHLTRDDCVNNMSVQMDMISQIIVDVFREKIDMRAVAEMTLNQRV